MQRPALLLCLMLAAETALLPVTTAAPSGQACHLSQELASRLAGCSIRGFQVLTPNGNNADLLPCSRIFREGFQALLRHDPENSLLRWVNATFTKLSDLLPAHSQELCDTDYMDAELFIKEAQEFLRDVQRTMCH